MSEKFFIGEIMQKPFVLANLSKPEQFILGCDLIATDTKVFVTYGSFVKLVVGFVPGRQGLILGVGAIIQFAFWSIRSVFCVGKNVQWSDFCLCLIFSYSEFMRRGN